MSSHLRTHEKFTCCYCKKEFKNRSSLKRHFTVHQKVRIFRCRFKECDKSFRDKFELRHHEKIVHLLKKDFICPIQGCGARFKMNSQRNFHMRVHQAGTPFSCRFCDQKFKLEEYLKQHEKRCAKKYGQPVPEDYG